MVFTDLTIVGILLLQQGLSRKSVKSRAISANTRGTEKPIRPEISISTDSKAQAVREKEGSPSAEGLPDIHVTVFLISDQF